MTGQQPSRLYRTGLLKSVEDIEECEMITVYVREASLGLVSSLLLVVGTHKRVGN